MNRTDFCLFSISGRKSAGAIDEEEDGNHRANEYFNDNEDEDENDENGEEGNKKLTQPFHCIIIYWQANHNIVTKTFLEVLLKYCLVITLPPRHSLSVIITIFFSTDDGNNYSEREFNFEDFAKR